MTQRCPLCRSGFLSLVQRDLVFRDKTLPSDAYLCSACRETVLDGAQVEKLREAVRREGLAQSDADVERVLERMMLNPA